MTKSPILLLVVAVLLVTFAFPATSYADGGATALAAQTGTVSASSFAWVRSGPGTQFKQVGRVYKGAAVTVFDVVKGQAVYSGNPNWYRIGDGRYVYSALVHLSGPVTPPPTGQPSGGEKWIEVILSQYKLIAYEGNQPVLTTIVGIGKRSTPTVKGTFHVYAKYRYRHMGGPGYYLPNVPHTMFFYRGYAIHGTYWHTKFGQGVSHGCVNVNLTDAARLFEWAPNGIKVVIHD